jgi:hypothetical protein
MGKEEMRQEQNPHPHREYSLVGEAKLSYIKQLEDKKLCY